MDMKVPSAQAQLHVLQVVGNGIVGGVETHVERLAERLPHGNIRLSALCPYESRFTARLRDLGVDVQIAPMPEEALWSSIQTACGMVRAGKIDLLHAHMPNAHLLAALAGKLCGKPVLTTIHARQLSPLDLELHRSADTHVNVVCRHSYFHALGMGVDAGRLDHVPNGVDIEAFKPRARGEEGLRQRLGVPADAPIVAFIGRLSHEKGPMHFAQMVLLLRGLVPSAHCVMVGDGPVRAELQGFIDRHRMAACLHLLGVRHDVADLHRDIDIVVSTSHTEAAPLALMEAMASGLPVAATSVGGVPEMIAPGLTGALLRPDDPGHAAHEVAAMLGDAGHRRQLGLNARAHAVAHFDLALCAQRTQRLLEHVARAPRMESLSGMPAGAGQRR